MAVSSFMVSLGTSMPEFALRDLDGAETRSADLAGDAVLVVFLSNHCPYVRHIERQFAVAAREFAGRGVAVVGIASNDPGVKASDGADGIREQIARTGFAFPYLLDTTQEVAKRLPRRVHAGLLPLRRKPAARLPRRVRRQPAEERHPGDGRAPARGRRPVLAGEPVPTPHQPSLGCSIKWAPGNEPAL